MTKNAAIIISFLAVFASSIMFFYFPLQERGFDWIYFDSLALVIKSSILNYGTLPIHNPWACSGLSILSNPQNWIFSPFILLTMIFPPTLGNIFSVVLLKFLGFWGCIHYFSQNKVSNEIAFLSAALFVNSNWFSLHFHEGHIAFRTFYLLPWIFLWIENLKSRKQLFNIGLVLSLMILDGGIYPAIFSIIYFVLFFLTSPILLRELLFFLKRNLLFTLGFGVVCLLLTMPKIYPVIVNSGAVSEIQEHQNMTLSLFLNIFFNPILDNTLFVQGYLRFHEYGNYLGFSVVIIIMLFIFYRNKIEKAILHKFILMFVFLWIAMGWGEDFNPYQLISSIPLIKKAHVHTRYVIIFSILFISIISIISSKIKFKKIVILLLSLANIETLVANYHSFSPAGTNYQLPIITRENWSQTNKFIMQPDLFYKDGAVSKFCYEPSALPTLAKSIDESGYRGEVSLLSGEAQIGQLKLIPGEITFNYSSPRGAELLLNTNYLDGWIETNDKGDAFNFKTLLAVRVSQGQGVIRLQYFPNYYTLIILSCIAGLIGLLFIRKKIHEL